MDSIRYLNRSSTADSDPPMRVSEPGDDNETRDTSSLLGRSYRSSSPSQISPQGKPVKGAAELFGSNDVDAMDTMGSVETTPRAKNSELTKRSSLFDSSVNPSSKSSSLTFDSSRGHLQTSPQNKVMTPAQFERYRHEQEMLGGGSKTDVSDDDSDHYDDDDEAERNKLLAKQRRKQEAHLAVYRQQMMKMTGEQPSDLPDIGPLRPGLDRASVSAPAVGQRGSTPTFSFDKASRNSDDEDDENVPLGVLAAHGFPNKNRPPTALANNGVQYSSESYPPPPKSTSGASTRVLPPFAKNLPADPYYGAGLVNPPNRETPSFNTHGGSTYGGSSPNMPPGGLVGVIAGEERARAMRRGSPNTQGSYGSPLPQGMPGGMPQMLSPGDEAQLQMSQQMSQMMQMQMQWMQQMQQMMAGQPQQQQPQPHQLPQMPPPLQQAMGHNFLSPQGQLPRPMSHSAPGSPALTQQQQRAMSMMSPTMSPQWATQGYGKAQPGGGLGGPTGYAPSIAPSERSNVGMPTRYRPVSIAPADEHARPASQASSQMLLQAGGERRTNVSPSNNNSNSKSSPSPRKVPSDDDDEEGWEEMKKKRQQKASTWRLKKSRGDDLKEMYYPGP